MVAMMQRETVTLRTAALRGCLRMLVMNKTARMFSGYGLDKTARMFSGYGLDTRWDVPKRAAQS